MDGADRSRRLPPGQHGIPPELIARNQRERLIAAMAEECTELGYAGSTVAGLARRAGVSTGSFYKQFEDRRACMLASFEELWGRLAEEVERACEGGEPAEKVRIGIRTAAALLAADLPTARLLTIEVVAAGPEGVRLQHEAIERLAERLREVRESSAPPSFPGPEWVTVAAMVAVVAKRVAEGEELSAEELEAVCKGSEERFSKGHDLGP